MSKIYSEARIIVTSQRQRYRNYYPGEARKDCEYLAKQIRKHIDDVGQVIIEDTDPVCSHCGKKWTEENPRYNGGCCKLDEENATPADYLTVYPEESIRVSIVADSE